MTAELLAENRAIRELEGALGHSHSERKARQHVSDLATSGARQLVEFLEDGGRSQRASAPSFEIGVCSSESVER